MVTPLKFVGDDHALVQALRAGHPGAVVALYDRHASNVQRTLRSALGVDPDLPDLLQEVFIRALDRVHTLDDCERLRAWLTTIAVFTARGHLRRRRRRAWLNLFSPDRALPRLAEPHDPEAHAALRQTYQILDELPVDERMAFALRIVSGLTLPEAAEACGVSLSTFKRRLARAERAFLAKARQHPILNHWLERGERWSLQNQA